MNKIRVWEIDFDSDRSYWQSEKPTLTVVAPNAKEALKRALQKAKLTDKSSYCYLHDIAKVRLVAIED